MLQVHKLCRSFGDITAVNDVSFAVKAGHMTGFVGGNGAGKTTTMRMIMGVLSPSAGDVTFQGKPLTDSERRFFGYMPEERGLYPKQKVLDQLVYLATLRGVAASEAKAEAMSLMERFDLGDRASSKLEKLSLGNQQRVQIMAAVMSRPSALILDEPFSGLDPGAVDAMVDLLREHTCRGVPVLFSSHQLDLVDRLCDDLVILASGRVVGQGTADELRARATTHHQLVLGGDAGWVRGVDGVHVLDVDGHRAVLTVTSPGADQDLLAEALRRGTVTSFGPIIPTLGEIYREAVA